MPLSRRHKGKFADPLVWISDYGLQQSVEVSDESKNCCRIEKVCAEEQISSEASVHTHHRQRHVKLGRAGSYRGNLEFVVGVCTSLGTLISASRWLCLVLEIEHYLEERIDVQVPSRLEFFNNLLERNVLVCLRAHHYLAHTFEHFGKSQLR